MFGCLLSTCVNGHCRVKANPSEMDILRDNLMELSQKLIKSRMGVYALSAVRNGELIFVVQNNTGEYRQIQYSGNIVKFYMNINSNISGSWCFIQGELSEVNLFDPNIGKILSVHTDIVKKYISHGNKLVVLKLAEQEIMSLISV